MSIKGTKHEKFRTYLSDDDKEKIVKRYKEAQEQGIFLSQKSLAEEFGVTQPVASYVLRKAGVKTRTNKEANPPTFDVEGARKLYEANPGMSLRELGEKLGVNPGALQRQFSNEGVEAHELANYAKYQQCNRHFFAEVTPKTAYFAGFTAADGFVAESGLYVAYGVHPDDVEILDNLRRAANLDQPIRDWKNNFDRMYKGLTISSRDWVSDLKRHYNIVYKKSLILEPPNFSDPALVWPYLRGYCDGDGHISEEGTSVVLTTGSQKFIDWIIQTVDAKPSHIQEHMWHTAELGNYISARSVHYTGEARRHFVNKIYENSTPETRLTRKYERACNRNPRCNV